MVLVVLYSTVRCTVLCSAASKPGQNVCSYRPTFYTAIIRLHPTGENDKDKSGQSAVSSGTLAAFLMS